MSDSFDGAKSQWDAEVFSIPYRPERRQLQSYPVRDDDGDIIIDDGKPKMAGGGSVIEGYCRFDLTADAYDRDAANEALKSYEAQERYLLSWWEPYNALVFDNTEMCMFEVRVLPDRTAIDVKSNTTVRSVHVFAESFVSEMDGEWDVERTSEQIAYE